MDDREPKRAEVWGWTLLATLPALRLLAWQTSFVTPFFSDDAFISLRYSERLLAGHGLTWTDGERVEGYSNLLWVLLCSALGALGMDLVAAARLLGVVASAVALCALARALRPHDLRSAAVAALAPLLAASTQVVLGWTRAGLEGPLVFCLLALGCSAFVRAPDVASWPRAAFVRTSVPFALLCWTRPDAPLWVAGVAAALVPATRRLAPAVAFAALPLAAALAQLAFRALYYGDVVPNTAHVKADFAPAAWGAGWRYALDAVAAHGGLFAAALAGTAWALAQRNRRPLALLLALPACGWLLYLVAIGGDHFPGRRLLHGAIAPLALLAAAPLLHAGPRARAAFAALLAAGTAGNAWLARTDAQSHELRGEVWEWRGREVGSVLRAAFGEQRPLLAVDAAGAIPFYSGLPALDLLGLCDRTIATTPLPAWLDTVMPGTPKPPGHLHGNGAYAMDRAPDLLLFANPPHLPLPVFVSALEFEHDPRFQNGYRCVLVELPPRPLEHGVVETLRVPLWVALAGVVGVARAPDRVQIPAYLFGAMQLTRPLLHRRQLLVPDAARDGADAAHAAAWQAWYTATDCVATPDAASGALRLRLGARTASLRIPLAAGRYRAAVVPADAPVAVHIEGAAGAAGELVVDADGACDLQLRVADGAALPALVERVELVRRER